MALECSHLAAGHDERNIFYLASMLLCFPSAVLLGASACDIFSELFYLVIYTSKFNSKRPNNQSINTIGSVARGFPIKIWLQSDLTKVPLVIGSNCQNQTSANTKMGQLSSFYLNSNHTISLSQMLCLNQSTRDRMWLKRFQGTSIHRRTQPPTICSTFLLILSNLQGITPLNKDQAPKAQKFPS